MAHSFGTAFTVGTILVAVCALPALLLPRRKKADAPTDADAAAMMH
jgi:hypothetical protein